MEMTPLNRRGFLRLCVVAAGGTIAAACQSALQETEVVASSTASPSPVPTKLPSQEVSLAGADQDVWAWIKPVKVAGPAVAKPQDVFVSVNGREFETQKDGEYFTTEIRLSTGINRISATYKQPDGGEIRSNMQMKSAIKWLYLRRQRSMGSITCI